MPPVKKQSRPRIDAIVRHIKAGSYDDEMEQIKEAIDARNEQRRDAVLKLVKQVYGDKARVETEEPTYEPGSHAKVARRARPGGPPPSEPLSDDPVLRAAEEAALARERELEAEYAAAQANGDPSDEESGIESRSPAIGSMVPEQ